ncbi:M48 family metallopeptidase [Planktomarina sp.]|nr:M48 family metallopeptidase [Planktomarina sp.]
MNLLSNTADRQIILPGRPEIKVLLRPSRRASRLSLRISRLKGQVTLSLPLSCPMVQAENFVLEKESWIRAHLADLPRVAQAGFDRQLPFAGRQLTICPGAGRQVELSGDRLLVPGRESLVPARVKAFLKLQARLALQEAVDRFSERLGRPYGRLTLRDTTSRWGSCSTQGNLNFSWRLIMAPPEVLRYVAAHEVAHLEQMNHSAAFWALVERLFPGHQAQRDWLKRHGEDLHRYQF